jgi:hypothetical protein
VAEDLAFRRGVAREVWYSQMSLDTTKNTSQRVATKSEYKKAPSRGRGFIRDFLEWFKQLQYLRIYGLYHL